MHRSPLISFVILSFVICLFASLAPAQQKPEDIPPVLREYAYLQEQMQESFKAGEYQKAAEICNGMLQLVPDDPNAYYNRACANARLKQPKLAMEDLTKAVANGWTDADHMATDDDLESLRNDKAFPDLIADSRLNERAGGAKYEKGDDIPSVTTLEAFPDDGLRYRLRIPKDATAEKPARLIVWLHPAGNSLNRQIEKLAPDFAAHGFALVVFTHKIFQGWSPEDGDALLSRTLPDLATHKQIDSERPILLGSSAGGQFALDLWKRQPDVFAGLILTAAYPITFNNRRILTLDLPPAPANIKKTPIHVLVGEKDPDLHRWDMIENKWLKAGVPLTISRVPGKGAGWLLTADPLKETLHWLDEIKAGKLPADTPKPLEIDF